MASSLYGGSRAVAHKLCQLKTQRLAVRAFATSLAKCSTLNDFTQYVAAEQVKDAQNAGEIIETMLQSLSRKELQTVCKSPTVASLVESIKNDFLSHGSSRVNTSAIKSLVEFCRRIKSAGGDRFQPPPYCKELASVVFTAIQKKILVLKPADVGAVLNGLFRLGLTNSAAIACINETVNTSVNQLDSRAVTSLLAAACRAGCEGHVKDRLAERLAALSATFTVRDIAPVLGTLKTAGIKNATCRRKCKELAVQLGDLPEHMRKSADLLLSQMPE